MTDVEFDGQAAHRIFSAECVNRAWDQMAVYLAEARRVAEQVPKLDYRKQLEDDLDSIGL